MIPKEIIGTSLPQDIINPSLLAGVGQEIEEERYTAVQDPRFAWRVYAVHHAMDVARSGLRVGKWIDMEKSVVGLPEEIFQKIPVAESSFVADVRYYLQVYKNVLRPDEFVREVRAQLKDRNGGIVQCLMVHMDDQGIFTKIRQADFNADEFAVGIARSIKERNLSDEESFFMVPLVVPGDEEKERERKGIDYAIIKMDGLYAQDLVTEGRRLREALERIRIRR